jgi:serine/threonine protein kinase
MTDPTVNRLNAALEGRYSIERQLGEGGMATVCLADDLKPDGKVARQVLKPELATESTFSPGQPTILFTWSYNAGGNINSGYDIHPDGERFLVRPIGVGGSGLDDVYIVTNWFEELRERMGN